MRTQGMRADKSLSPQAGNGGRACGRRRKVPIPGPGPRCDFRARPVSWHLMSNGPSPAHLAFSNQLVNVLGRRPQPGDLGFLLGDERVEQWDLPGVVPLLVLAEAEEVRLVLGPPAVE